MSNSVESFFVPIPKSQQQSWGLKSIGIYWDGVSHKPLEMKVVKSDATFSGIVFLDLEMLSKDQLRLVDAIQKYIAGDFKHDADMVAYLLSCARGTAFQKAVWKSISQIPLGKVATYAEVAVQCGYPKAVRAVGSACGKNPFPFLIPCHRVVGSNSIGGYGFGTELKRVLLKREHAEY